jgi:hypothetical protein
VMVAVDRRAGEAVDEGDRAVADARGAYEI